LAPRKKINKNNEELSTDELYDVLSFAKQMYNYNGIFTPDLVNAKMKDINLNPIAATEEGINTALLNPKSNERNLQGYSEYFQLTNMLYKRTLEYLDGMLSFDYTYSCKNAFTPADYKSKAYKDDIKILNDFLDRFEVKKEFKKVMKNLVSQEIMYTVLRTDGDLYTLQELPSEYCKITGRWDYGLLFDFNMMWFINQPAVDINMYPKVFKKYYKRVIDSKNNGYLPSNLKRDSEWIYWVQTNPEDGLWSFKFRPEQITQIPFLAPLFPDLSQLPLMRSLQRNKSIMEASRLIVGIIPLLKDNKSGNVKDMLAISPETAGKFANLMRNGLSEAFKVGIAPFESVEAPDFKISDHSIMNDYNKNTVSMTGINSRMIYSNDRQNAEETRNSIGVDEYMLYYIYPYFNNFMEFHINQRTKKYKFKFNFEGTEFPQNRQIRFDNVIALADKGIILPQKFAAAIGMEYKDFERQRMEAGANSWVDSLTPILTSFTMSGKDLKDGGAPKKKDSQVGDSGIAKRDSGGEE